MKCKSVYIEYMVSWNTSLYYYVKIKFDADSKCMRKVYAYYVEM